MKDKKPIDDSEQKVIAISVFDKDLLYGNDRSL